MRAASQKGTLTDELKWLFLTAMENVFGFFSWMTCQETLNTPLINSLIELFYFLTHLRADSPLPELLRFQFTRSQFNLIHFNIHSGSFFQFQYTFCFEIKECLREQML